MYRSCILRKQESISIQKRQYNSGVRLGKIGALISALPFTSWVIFDYSVPHFPCLRNGMIIVAAS